MADENYTLPEVPVYREAIRKILNEDPVNAEEVLNPLVQALLENIAAVKGIADGKVNADLSNVDNTDFKNKALEAGAGGIPIVEMTSEDGKNYTAEIPGITELKNGMTIVVIPNKMNLSGGTGSEVTLTINDNPELKSRIRMKLYGSLGMWDNLPSAYFSPEVPFTLKYHSFMGFWAVETHWISEYDITGTIPVSKGGTGATTAADARKNLGVPNVKRTARFTVGTSTAGWTADQVDYLCDGTADDVEINAAIQALPPIGGEVVILDGEYIIDAPIILNKYATAISGNGAGSILKRNFNDTPASNGLVRISESEISVKFLTFDGNRNICKSAANKLILISGGTSIIKGNIFRFFRNSVSISSSYNILCGNIFHGGSRYAISMTTCIGNTIIGNSLVYNNTGIYIGSNARNNTITGNCCFDNDCGILLNNSFNNTITSNTCIRSEGSTSDYTSSQYTIKLDNSNNNLIAGNNIMGKNYVDSGTGNTFANNKY